MLRPIVAALMLLSPLSGCRPEAPEGAAREETPREKDRRELTLQSRRGWKPVDAPLRLELQLIAEKSGIVKAAKFRYRLEIKNIGREPVVFKEDAPTFIKDGSLCGSRGYRFYVTPPNGAEMLMACEPPPASAPAGAGLEVTLQPGDYLLTRAESPSSRFRDLRTMYRFDRPGTYRVKVVYSAAKRRAQSNTVTFDVLR